MQAESEEVTMIGFMCGSHGCTPIRQTIRKSAITSIYFELWTSARRTNTDQRRTLRSGARMTVRAVGNVTALTIARCEAPVGETEEHTFRRDCSVPDTAARVPAIGQNQREEMLEEPCETDRVTWNLITFCWNHETNEAADVPKRKKKRSTTR